MTKQVQVAGGPATQENVYTGPTRELRVDETNGDLRIHDGSTPGGKRVMNQANSDARYQAKNDEFDGFEFKPEERGVMVRRTTGDYRIRKIKTSSSLSLSSEDGYDGDFELDLAEEIAGEHTALGQWLFQDVVQFDSGLNGDTSGTHTGSVVGNVTGNVTGNLTGNTNGTHTGALDVRGAAINFDNGQIPADAVAGFGSSIGAAGVPIGGIIMWSGLVSNIPSNYALCDGNNGTPNLTDKMIMGAGSTYTVGQTGGAASATPTITVDSAGLHSHPITVDGHSLTIGEMPSHTHSITSNGSTATSGSRNISGSDTSAPQTVTTNSAGSGDPHSHTASSTDSGTHVHTASSSAISLLPTFFALALIQRKT